MFTLKFDTDGLTMRQIAEVLRDVADRMQDRAGANYAPNVDGNIHAPEPLDPSEPIGKFRYRS